MSVHVGGETRINLIQNVPTIVERPHLANRLVAYSRHDTAYVIEHNIDGSTFFLPIFLRIRKLQPDRVAIARLFVNITHSILGSFFMGKIVDSGTNVNRRLQHGMERHILYFLAINPDLAAVADRIS